MDWEVTEIKSWTTFNARQGVRPASPVQQDSPVCVSCSSLGNYKYFKTGIVSYIEIPGDKYREEKSQIGMLMKKRKEAAGKLESAG